MHAERDPPAGLRQPEEMDERLGRIPGARLLPLSTLKGHLSDIPQNRPVITVCHAGMRSGQATAKVA